MRVADAPAREEDLAHVGLAVAVGVLEEQRVGRLQDDHAAVVAKHAGRNVQALGEDLERVGPAVAVGVFADRDPVAPLAVAPLDVGIVDALGDPEPAAMVPGHADRLVDLGLGGEQPRLEAGRDDQVLDRLLRRQRLLHLVDRLALRPPLAAGQIVGDRRPATRHR